MTVRLTCVGCGSGFFTKPYRAEAQKYCNKECRKAHLGKVVTLRCECCGSEFSSYTSQLERNPRRTCSVECRRKLTAAKPRPEKVAREPVFKVCKTCNTEFRVPPSRAETAQYCSTACKGNSPEYREKSSKVQRGEKSRRFTGGIVVRNGYATQDVWGDTKRLETTSHRLIVTEAILAEDPAHPFLTVIDGATRLRPEIHVHHIDRIRLNNSLSNLLAVTAGAHVRIHRNGKKPDPWECWPSNPPRW